MLKEGADLIVNKTAILFLSLLLNKEMNDL